MELHISHVDIRNYVLNHYGKDISLQTVDSHTIRIGANVNAEVPRKEQNPFGIIKSLFTSAVALVSKQVTLDLSVEEVKNNGITLQYENGIGKDILIGAVLKYIKISMPQYSNIVEERNNRILVVNLSNISQLKHTLDMVSLNRFSFVDNNVVIEAALK